jgi:regulatory protein
VRPARPPKLLALEALKTYAARSLAARAQSLTELRTRLRKKAERPGDVDEILAYLQESGYVDDQRFATAFAGWRKDNQGFGQGRVLRDLLARRVSSEVAKSAAEAAFQGTDEVALIEAHLARKYRGKNLKTYLAEQKNLASAFRRLRTAGFSSANSIRVLKRYASAAEEIDESEDESPGE